MLCDTDLTKILINVTINQHGLYLITAVIAVTNVIAGSFLKCWGDTFLDKTYDQKQVCSKFLDFHLHKPREKAVGRVPIS